MARKPCDPGPYDEESSPRAPDRKPAWAHGLRKLYDEVVAEPLPACFAELLTKLDEADTDEAKTDEVGKDGADSGGAGG